MLPSQAIITSTTLAPNYSSTPAITDTPSFVFTNESSIDEELKCPVCLDVYPLDAVCCRSCMNAYCRACVENQQRCPLCRNDTKPLQKIPLPLRNILAKLKVNCTACSRTEIPRGDFDYHVQHSCPIDCPYGCESKITRASFSLHETECSQKPVKCSSAEFGCIFEASRSKVTSHEVDCPFVKISPILARQKRDIRELRSLVSTQHKRILELELECDLHAIKKQKIHRTSHCIPASPSPSPGTPVPFPIVPRPHHASDRGRSCTHSNKSFYWVDMQDHQFEEFVDFVEEPVRPAFPSPTNLVIEIPAKPHGFPFDSQQAPSPFFDGLNSLQGITRGSTPPRTTRWI